MKMYSKAILATAFSFAVVSSVFAMDVVEKFPFAVDAPKALQLLDSDRFVGKEDAPIQIVEYASLTCGHCANFHAETYPKLKEDYIDKGLVRFTLRPLPWDNRALATSLVAYCAPRDQYNNYMSAFFSSMPKWARSSSFLKDVKTIARLGGMKSEDVEKCIADPDVRAKMDETIAIATKSLGVDATPAFFINGHKTQGAIPYAQLKAFLDSYLKDIEKEKQKK